MAKTYQVFIMVQLFLRKLMIIPISPLFQLSRLMHTMGFGPYMSCLMYLLGLEHCRMKCLMVELHQRLAFASQDDLLSPLLFAIVPHTLMVMLSRHATNDDILGLHLPFEDNW